MIELIKKYDWRKYNISLLCVVVVLCLISALCVKLAGGDEHGAAFMKGQIVGMFLGLFLVAVLSVIDYHFICRFTAVYYIVGILLTVATKSPLGRDNDTGTFRWVQIGPITFQPTELMKIILILTLATLYVKLQYRINKISTIFIVGLVSSVPVLVILLQPDLSSSLVAVFIMIVLIFTAGTSYRILAPFFIVGIPSVFVLFWYIQQPDNFILKKYQYRRIMAWLHPDTFPGAEDLNRQQNNAIRAIASGKLYGKYLQDGAAEGSTRAYDSVYVNESDFIWSVIGEEFGFLGSCLILLLLAIVIFKCFMVAKKSQDLLGKMIAMGVAAMFMFQVFANICVVTRIFPNTGLPLPFLSNGLSSMVCSMIGIGFVLNIGIQPAKNSKQGFSMRNQYGSDAERDIDLDLEL